MAGVSRVGPGTYSVTSGSLHRLVYVASSDDSRWAFCDGEVYVLGRDSDAPVRPGRSGAVARGAHSLTAPMPATIVRVLVAPGTRVRKGDTVVVAEAMKMELPIRAPADAVVTAVRCREGELVQPDQPLVELE